MKRLIYLVLLFPLLALAAGEVNIAPKGGYTPGSLAVGQSIPADSKAALEVESTTKGVLPPRLTTTQQNAIASPTEGLWIYNSTTKVPALYNGTGWLQTATQTGAEDITGKTLLTVDNITLNGSAITTSSGALSLTGTSGILSNGPFMYGASLDSATTGANQDIAAGTTRTVVVFSNASLTSIRNVVGTLTIGQVFMIVNATGGTLTIVNDSGGTATDRIVTGLGANLPLANGTGVWLVYDGNSLRWRVVSPSPNEAQYLLGVTSAIQTQLDAKVAKATLTAKGSIYAASAASTPAELTVGTDGYVLTANSATSTGLEWAESTGGAGGIFAGGQNLIDNNSFEVDTSGWTASAGTFARSTTNGQFIPPGVASAHWDAAASNDTLVFTATTINANDGLAGRNGVVSCAMRALAGTATHTIQAYDGTNILVSSTMTSSTTNFNRTSANFIFPASGTIQPRIVANANEPDAVFDDCYIGLAEGFNVSQVSQAEMYGYLKYAGTSNCVPTTGNTAAAMTEFAADTDCPAPTVGGNASAPATKVPRIKFASLPPGEYQVCVYATMGAETPSVSATQEWQLYDGTSISGKGWVAVSSTDAAFQAEFGIMCGRFTYTTAQTNIEFRPRALSSSDSNDPTIAANTAVRDLEFVVYRFPLQSQTSFKPDEISWQVIADITGANPSLGIASVASYTEITDSGLTLTPVTGSAPAGIMCEDTNAATAPSSSATVCAAGSEAIGANFNIPKAGWYEACFDFVHFVQLDSAETLYATFQVAQTATTCATSPCTTMTYEGGPRKMSGLAGETIATGTNSGGAFPHSDCGQMYFSSAGNVGIRLMYEQAVTGTPNISNIYADQGATYGQPTIRLTVKPMQVQQPAPLLVNTVVSSYTGISRVEWVNFSDTSTPATACNQDPCVIVRQSGGVSSVGRTSTGLYTINFSPAWAEAPSCTFNSNSTATILTGIETSAPSTTQWLLSTYNPTPVLSDGTGTVTCMGKR